MERIFELNISWRELLTDDFTCFCSILQGLVDFDGYYLERDPCLVCNNPEVPFAVSICRL